MKVKDVFDGPNDVIITTMLALGLYIMFGTFGLGLLVTIVAISLILKENNNG